MRLRDGSVHVCVQSHIRKSKVCLTDLKSEAKEELVCGLNSLCSIHVENLNRVLALRCDADVMRKTYLIQNRT